MSQETDGHPQGQSLVTSACVEASYIYLVATKVPAAELVPRSERKVLSRCGQSCGLSGKAAATPRRLGVLEGVEQSEFTHPGGWCGVAAMRVHNQQKARQSWSAFVGGEMGPLLRGSAFRAVGSQRGLLLSVTVNTRERLS